MTHLATLSPASPSTPTPDYHVTMTSVEYEALRHFGSADTSFSISLTPLPTPSTSSTSTHPASFSPLWIIDSGSSSHMTRTSSLLSSYHSTPSHPPITFVDGRPCMVQGYGISRVTKSLSLHQLFYVPDFPVNLLSISVITCTFPCTVTFFLSFHFPDLYTGLRIGLGHEKRQGIYELVFYEPSSGLRALLVKSLASSSLLWHHCLRHPYFENF